MSQTASRELYDKYVDITQKAADFQYAAAVLGWDQEVYMPEKGFSWRGRQLATLASQSHEMLTSGSYGALLEELASKDDIGDDELRNVQLSLEDYLKNKKLPADFIKRLSEQTSRSYSAWMQARKENNYAVYAPELGKMIALKRQQADLYGYETHPYDALMDEYEKGATVATLDPVFKMVSEQLLPFLKKIAAAKQQDDGFFFRRYPKQQQWDFSLDVLKQMGYDFAAGRQDYAEHPFSTSFAPTDVRITTRVNENDFSSLLWSSIHEGGHALYEQGLPEHQYGLPLSAPVSLSIHESQSRLWENCVGRSKDFWKYFYPRLQNYFPDQLCDVGPEGFYKGMNKVEPSLVRTEADELTYHFHVMIRYGIEKQLITGELDPGNLKTVWNESYRDYLGVTVPDDKKGVLQDVHWSHGSFGYFPTYSLGSFYAAQFFRHAMNELPGLQTQIEQGNFTALLAWLRKNIHSHGRRYPSEELCKRITGSGLDFSFFMHYVENKYGDIYGIHD